MARVQRRQAARKTARRPARAPQTAPAWLMFGAGLGLGLFVALLVFLNVDGETGVGTGFKNLIERNRVAAGGAEPEAALKPRPHRAEPAPQPKKPKFDFYTVLPEFESVLPEGVGETQPATPAPGDRRDVRYILQAASFSSLTDADMLRARLALHDLDAHIEKVAIEGKGDYYRVRLGPFAALGELNRVHKRLYDLGINAIRLRVRERNEPD